MESEALLLTTKQAAELLSISERTLWTLTNAGEVPCVHPAKRCVRYARHDLEDFIRRKTTCNRRKYVVDSGNEETPASQAV